MLLCATKDNEAVEYALSRAVSPALVAEYKTALPDKQLLQAKLHEFYESAERQQQAKALPAPPQTTHRPKKNKARRAGRKDSINAYGHCSWHSSAASRLCVSFSLVLLRHRHR